MQAMRGEGPSTEPNHVLVVGQTASAADADQAGTSNVIGVTYGTDAESWLSQFQAGQDRVAVVSVGEHSRTAVGATAGQNAGMDVLASVTGTVETVPEVDDVASVGVLVNDYLSAWQGTGETTVFVDDLGDVLDVVSAETAFRFVHALLARTSSMDARVVAGFDTSKQPPHVVDTFAQLFDEVREGA